MEWNREWCWGERAGDRDLNCRRGGVGRGWGFIGHVEGESRHGMEDGLCDRKATLLICLLEGRF
jgi:hypothetical protein